MRCRLAWQMVLAALVTLVVPGLAAAQYGAISGSVKLLVYGIQK